MKKIRKGDMVVLITGRDKGRKGAVIEVLADDRVRVEGLNMSKKHQRPNPQMFLGHVEALDAHAVVRQHLDDGAFASLVPTGDQNHHVAFANLFHLPIPNQSTSGASEMIFMN